MKLYLVNDRNTKKMLQKHY